MTEMAEEEKPKVEKPPEKGFLENTNIDAIGRHVGDAIVNWLSDPETLLALLDFFTKNRKLIRKLARKKRQRRPSASSTAKPCSEEGCEEPIRARGLCGKHYSRVRYQEIKKERPEPQIRGVGTCSTEGCEKSVHARGMCGTHFMEWVRAKRKDEQSEKSVPPATL